MTRACSREISPICPDSKGRDFFHFYAFTVVYGVGTAYSAVLVL